MLEFAKVFFGGVIIILAFIGWGFVFSRIVLKKSLDWGFCAAIGLALAVILGGILNITQKIGYFWNSAYLAIGVLACAVFVFQAAPAFFRKFKRPAFFSLLMVMLAMLLVLVKYSAAVSPTTHNLGDDYQAYFVFPEKMWQTGSMGQDPFSERKIISSLGGQYYLDTFILDFGQDKNLGFLDSGVGFVIFLGCLLGLLKGSNLSFFAKNAIIFSAILIPAPIVNITGIYTAAVVFLCLYRLIFWEQAANSKTNILLAAVLVAGACALKISLIPFGGLLLVAYYYFLPNQKISISTRTKYFFSAVILVVLFLSPWMASMFRSSGTFLYPFLGKGFHGSRYGNFLTPLAHVSIDNFLTLLYDLQNIVMLVFVLLLIFEIWQEKRNFVKKEENKIWLAIMLAVAGSAVATAGYGVSRYSFSFVFPFLLVFIAKRLEENPFLKEASWPAKPAALFYIFVVCLLMGSGVNDFFGNEKNLLASIAFGIRNQNIVSREEFQEYKNMQSAVPAGQTILVRLDKHFSLDFKRNQIFIADYPGGQARRPACLIRRVESL